MTNTPITDISVEDYVRELSRLLVGLPRADVTEIIEEVRSHLREQIADCGVDETNRGADDADRAVEAFGTPQEFAAQVMERLGLAPGGPIKDATGPLRAVARTVDVAVGLLPLFPMFFSPVLAIGLIAGPFLGWGGMTLLTSLLVVFYLALCALWGVWYLRWLPRSGHSGIGMRLTGLSRVRVAGRWRIVPSIAVAENADAKRRARPRTRGSLSRCP